MTASTSKRTPARLLILLAGTALAAPCAATARAQEVPEGQDSPAEAQASGLEDIVVTAQKRREGLQNIPIAISAVTSETLSERGFTNASQLTQIVPNLQFDPTTSLSGSSSTAVIFIRGVGQTDFTLVTDPGVATYVNDVYISRSVGGVLNLMDIERIEVLRGPQGTLFGRNTIGGAISVTTKAPDNDPGGVVELTTGRYKRADARAMINVPIVPEALAVRASFSTKNRDGYGRRLIAGDEQGNENQDSGRVALRWWATPTLTIDLAFDGTRAREKSVVSTLLNRDDAYFNSGILSSLYNACVANLVDPGCRRRMPLAEQQFYDSRWGTGNPYTNNATGANYSDLDLWGVSGVIAWDAGPVSFKSITAFRKMHSRFGTDTDSSPLTIAEVNNNYRHQQFSQELQVAGTLFDERIKWLSGGYYFKEKGRDEGNVPLVPALFPALGIPVSVFGYNRVNNENYGVFAQVTGEMLDGLNLTLGGRYTHETKKVDVSRFVLSDINVPLVANPIGERSFNKFTPKVGLDYQVTRNNLVYASYSVGFKAGGFSARYTSPLNDLQSFEPETVKSFEIGSKNELFDRSLRLNLAAYYAKYENIQITVQEGVNPTTRNAAAGRIQGFEGEAVFVPTDALTLTAAVGFADAKYTRVSPLAQVTAEDMFVNTPKWTISGSAQYRVDLASAGSLTARGDVSYKSRMAKDSVNTPELVQPAYATVDARITYETADETTELALFLTNLTNKKYLLGGTAVTESFGFVTGTYSRPREWGVSLTRRF